MRTLDEYSNEYQYKVLNLGCGKSNPKEFYGIDIQDLPGVDMVANLNFGIQLSDNTFDLVLAKDFLEHIDMNKRIRIMEEIYRVLKPGGKLTFEVPSTDGNNRGAFADPTHVSFWNEISFWYYLDDKYGKGFRSLYDIKCWFIPRHLETYYNEWNVTYVRGVLEKQ